MLKINGVIWFANPRGSFGIVYGQNEIGERKAYIGPHSVGFDEAADTAYIRDHGAKIYPGQIKEVLDYLNKK